MLIVFAVLSLLLLLLMRLNRRSDVTEHFAANVSHSSIPNLETEDKLPRLPTIRYKKATSVTKMNRPVKMYKLPLPLDSISPPDNTPSKIKSELEFLSKIKPDTAVSQTYERDGVLSGFVKYAGENGLVYDESHLNSIDLDTETIAMKIQQIYGRPRPYLVAPWYGIVLRHQPIWNNGPCYPCSPVLRARMLAHVLSYNNPPHQPALFRLVKRIELSRLAGGYNYPSDIEAAVNISNVLKKHVKYLEAI